MCPTGNITGGKWVVEVAWESVYERHITIELVVPKEYLPHVLEEVHGGTYGPPPGNQQDIRKDRGSGAEGAQFVMPQRA